MKRKIWLIALAAALLLALLCGSAALADGEDPLTVSMALETNEFSAPKEITVSISVTNAGESDLPGPVTLYYPNNKQVEEFGNPTLGVGTTKSWTGKWKVTQAELDAGRITFKVRYSIYNADGELVYKAKNFSKKIIYTGGTPELKIERTIRPTTAQRDQEVTVTYDIENPSGVEVTRVTIKENSSISSKSGVIDSIPAGGKDSYTFTVKMGRKDLTSSATVSFRAGGKNYSQKVESAKIKYGEVKLTASLKADKKGGAPGETVKLTLTMKNSGTVDFTNVKVTDAALGEVFSDVTVEAGKTVILDKEITITETQDLQFTVTADDATGQPVETATGLVNVIATDPTQQIVLSLEASADRDVVYTIPGNVRFTITVRNESAVDVSNISIRAVDTVINTFDSIPAGESRTFTREMAVSMPGIYQFTASCRDQLSQTLTFSSNQLRIAHEQPTPEPTEAPIVTPPAPRYQEMPETYDDLTDSQKLPAWTDQVESAAGTAKWVLAGIAALGLVLLLIGGIRRGIDKSRSNKAMDHLDGANYRDYGSQPRRNRRSEIVSGSDAATGSTSDANAKAEEKQVENTAQDSDLMAETLRKLYNSENKAESAPEADAPTAEPEADKPPLALDTEGNDSSASSEGSRHRRTKA